MTENRENEANFSGWKLRTDPSMVASAKLCSRCQSLFDNWDSWLKPGNLFPHHLHPAELQSAALDHCPICYQFWRNGPRVLFVDGCVTDVSTLGTYELLGVEVQHHQYQPAETSVADQDFRLRLKFRIPHLGGNLKRRSFSQPPLEAIDPHIVSAYPGQAPLVFGEYSIVLSPIHRKSNEPSINEFRAQSTKSSLAMANRWLRECSSSHDTCKIRSLRHRPTRLVSTASGRCRVHHRNEFQTCVGYATLSHCWGTIKHLTLRKSNVYQLQVQIPNEALSRTIQDAITIARDLGFAYIWIDTLCIVQDDPEDWKREAADMSRVYGSSGLNIAAAGARDGRDGCFFPRPAHWNCQMELHDNDNSFSYCATPLSIYSSCLSKMPLMERGWVLQERLLAVRTLHFTTTELFWECNHNTVCESFPEKLPDFVAYTSKILHKKRLVDSMWPWIVTTYSGCKLTYAEDKLVAISGLAKEIQQQTNDQYVAGMWRRDLEAQLCWYTWSPEPRRKKGTYTAPSWSWAALDSQITGCSRDLSDSTVLICVLNVEVGHTGPDPLGAIDNATVRIRCYGLYGMRFDISNRVLLSSDNEGQAGITVYPDNTPDKDEEQFQDVLLLPIFESYGMRSVITGLVLQHVDLRKGVYQRFGIFHAPANGNLVESLGEIMNDEDAVNLSETYIEVLRDQSGTALGYVIDVI